MTAVEYLDFEIEIGHGDGREYPLAVIRSPGGEARERMFFPYDELALESRLKDLQIALLHSGGKRRKMLTPQESNVQEFGQKLFDALLSGEIRSRYDVSQREAARLGLGMRIKLRIQPPELASLPWEFIYDGRRAEYICLSNQTPLVRYIELPQVIQPLRILPPLRILGMIASPAGLTSLDTENEKLRMETALAKLTATRQVQIDWLEHANHRDLQRLMRCGQWHILHFIGHGCFDPVSDEGFIDLEDEHGELDRLPATKLAQLLADHASLRLAVLNSCESAYGGRTDIFSSTATSLVRRGLPAVLAMQYEITDKAAIEFSHGFYEALADGLPVDAATAEARKSINLGITNTIEWGTPVLFMRTPDGILFQHSTSEEQLQVEAKQTAREHAQQEADECAAREQMERESAKKLAAKKFTHEQAERKAVERAEQIRKKQAVQFAAITKPTQSETIKSPKSQPILHHALRLPTRMGLFRKQGIIPLWLKFIFQALIGLLAIWGIYRIVSILATYTPTDEQLSYNPQPLSDDIIDEQGVPMRAIPAGTFLMGSESGKGDEKPVHRVSLDAFAIDKYEVTNARYAACVKVGKCSPHQTLQSYMRESYYGVSKYANYPVIYITRNAAQAYCEWRDARLPTEAEWEYAARGGLESKDYPWGNELPSCIEGATNGANFSSCISDTNQIGRYAPNGYGLYDMAGNVWEWTADWYLYSYYSQSPFVNPTGPQKGSSYVVRGGSWDINSNNMIRVSIRSKLNPENWSNNIGFRCVR